jgi:hypothetical protein
MNEEIKKATELILNRTKETGEYKRRLTRLLELVPTGNYTDADVKQVVELATSPTDEEL